jgi:hypothetical protein
VFELADLDSMPHLLSHSSMSTVRQAVMPTLSFIGAGKVPCRTIRHIEALDIGNMLTNCFIRT